MRQITLEEHLEWLHARKAALGYGPDERRAPNSGARRTPEKRALLAKIEELKRIRMVVLDGAAVSSASDVYDALARALAFPGGFGRNLDALCDMLTTDVMGPVEIVWRDAEVSRARLGEVYGNLAGLLVEVARVRPDFRVRFE